MRRICQEDLCMSPSRLLVSAFALARVCNGKSRTFLMFIHMHSPTLILLAVGAAVAVGWRPDAAPAPLRRGLSACDRLLGVCELRSLLRLRGGVRSLHEGEWETLHDDAGEKLVVVDFTASWCGPCQRIAPAVESLAEEYGDAVVFVKVDVDELAELTSELGVTSMPTFLFFRSGDVIHTMRGANEEALREQVAAMA